MAINVPLLYSAHTKIVPESEGFIYNKIIIVIIIHIIKIRIILLSPVHQTQNRHILETLETNST